MVEDRLFMNWTVEAAMIAEFQVDDRKSLLGHVLSLKLVLLSGSR